MVTTYLEENPEMFPNFWSVQPGTRDIIQQYREHRQQLIWDGGKWVMMSSLLNFLN